MAIIQAPGMVSTHAHTTRPATPQRTADSRRVAPTPTMAPVIVCVVDTGMPAWDVKNSVTAAADSAATPPTGCSLVICEPIVFTIRQPPVSVPRAIAVWADEHDPQRHLGVAGQVAGADQHGEDDAHRLLGVVAAVAEAEGGGRGQLARPEPPVEPIDVAVAGATAHSRPIMRISPRARPISGDRMMNTPILRRPSEISTPKPPLATAAPAMPPTGRATSSSAGRGRT